MAPAKTQQLTRPLDSSSQKIIQEAVDGFIPEVAIDYQWDNYFYHSSVFESIARYNVTTTAGTVAVSNAGVVLTTGAVNGDTSVVGLAVTGSGLVQLNKVTRFRTAVQVSSVTGTTFEIISLVTNAGTSGSFIGFEIVNGVVTGVVSNGSLTSTSSLGSISANTEVLLEFRYTPKQIVVFYVNGVARGTLISGFPTSIGTAQSLMEAAVESTDGSAHSATISYWQFIQSK